MPRTGPQSSTFTFQSFAVILHEKVVRIGDLEKAVLQVKSEPSQRDLLRFLWIDKSDSVNPKSMKLRFARLPLDLPVPRIYLIQRSGII